LSARPREEGNSSSPLRAVPVEREGSGGPKGMKKTLNGTKNKRGGGSYWRDLCSVFLGEAVTLTKCRPIRRIERGRGKAKKGKKKRWKLLTGHLLGNLLP